MPRGIGIHHVGRARALGRVAVPITTLAVLVAGVSLAGSEGSGATGVKPPTIDALLPTSGSTAGGTTVTIIGVNLSSVTAVKFGSTTAASFKVVYTTLFGYEIVAKTKAHAAGTVTVSVTSPGGTSTSTRDYMFTSSG